MTLSPDPDSPNYKKDLENKKRNPHQYGGNWGGYKSPEERARMQDDVKKQREKRSKKEL